MTRRKGSAQTPWDNGSRRRGAERVKNKSEFHQFNLNEWLQKVQVPRAKSKESQAMGNTWIITKIMLCHRKTLLCLQTGPFSSAEGWPLRAVTCHQYERLCCSQTDFHSLSPRKPHQNLHRPQKHTSLQKQNFPLTTPAIQRLICRSSVGGKSKSKLQSTALPGHDRSLWSLMHDHHVLLSAQQIIFMCSCVRDFFVSLYLHWIELPSGYWTCSGRLTETQLLFAVQSCKSVD